MYLSTPLPSLLNFLTTKTLRYTKSRYYCDLREVWMILLYCQWYPDIALPFDVTFLKNTVIKDGWRQSDDANKQATCYISLTLMNRDRFFGFQRFLRSVSETLEEMLHQDLSEMQCETKYLVPFKCTTFPVWRQYRRLREEMPGISGHFTMVTFIQDLWVTSWYFRHKIARCYISRGCTLFFMSYFQFCSRGGC